MEFSQLESFIFEKIGESKLPGVAVALVKDDQVIWTKGFGFRDIERGLSATPHSLYGIGSITKSFTALAIMQLVERSLLSLEDPVEKYIPFPVKPHGELVRIWHLLTHTSGIPALAYAEAVIRGATRAGQTCLPISGYSDMLTFLREANEWVLDKPGARWFYLNEGYILLGMIIEVCSGIKYAEYISKSIFEPLGMKRSFFEKQDVESDPDNATPYVVTDDGQRRPSTYAYGSILSDGGIISNVLDLARKLLEHGADVNLDLGDGKSALYDFTDNQWHNQLRFRRIVVRAQAEAFDELLRTILIKRSDLSVDLGYLRRQLGLASSDTPATVEGELFAVDKTLYDRMIAALAPSPGAADQKSAGALRRILAFELDAFEDLAQIALQQIDIGRFQDVRQKHVKE